MPLPEPAPRQPIHARTLTMRGYEREDGLFDIEGQLTDTKAYAFDNSWRGPLQPGDNIHGMWLRLTVDDGFVIRDVAAVSDDTPFAICGAIAPDYRKLIGLEIGRGFNAAVKARLGGVAGCTHLSELVGRLAIVAFQTIAPLKERRARLAAGDGSSSLPGSGPRAGGKRPAILDTCHALRSDGPVVAEHWPAFYTETVQSAASPDTE